MRLEPFHLGPNLSLIIHWNGRMVAAMRKRYWAVSGDQPEADDYLREEYNKWEEIQDNAYEKVKRFYELTGGYPIVGDELHVSGNNRQTYYPGLLITRRVLFSIVGSDAMQLIYEVEGEKIMQEELEEYQEGDLVDDAD